MNTVSVQHGGNGLRPVKPPALTSRAQCRYRLLQRRQRLTLNLAQQRPDAAAGSKYWVISEKDPNEDGGARFVCSAPKESASGNLQQATAPAGNDSKKPAPSDPSDICRDSQASTDPPQASWQRIAASAAIMASLNFLTAACVVAAIRSVHWRAAWLLLKNAAMHFAHNGALVTWSILKTAALQLMAMHIALAAGARSNLKPRKDPLHATAAPPATVEGPQLQSGDAAGGTADGGMAARQQPGHNTAATGGLLSTALPWWVWALLSINCGLAALVDVTDVDGGITAWAIRLLVQDAAAHIMRHGASFFYGVTCGAWLLHYRHIALRRAEGL